MDKKLQPTTATAQDLPPGAEKITFVNETDHGLETIEFVTSPSPLDPAAWPSWFIVRTPTQWVAARVIA
jgi:hypothetical protein